MVTLQKIGNSININVLEITGLSTETKPLNMIDNVAITNGSIFEELDTGKTYIYDESENKWILQEINIDKQLEEIQQAGTEQIDTLLDEAEKQISSMSAIKDKVSAIGAEVSKDKTAVENLSVEIESKGDKILEEINSAVTNVTGSDIAAVKTHEGSAIIKELSGGTKQEKTSGYNLYNYFGLKGITKNGIKVSDVSPDGWITLNGTATDATAISIPLDKNIPSGMKCFIKAESNKTASVSVGFAKTSFLLHAAFTDTSKVVEGSINDIADSIHIYVTGNTTLTDFKFRAMFSTVDAPFEPYTGAAPSPNPEYPQTIKSIGGNGWFDGEWMVGSYDTTTGLYVSNSNFACNCDMIECKEGDTITINMEVEPKNTGIIFYDKDKNFLTSTVSFINQKAPSGSKYFNFRHQKDDNSIESLGQTIVTINNKYAVKLKTRGKNLLNKDLKKVAVGGAEYSVENDVITVTTLTSTANSPVAIFELGKAEDYKGKTLYIKCGNIIASSEDLVPKISVRLSDKKPGMVSSVKTIVEVFEKEKWVVATVPEDIGEANILSINFYVKTGSNPGIGAYAKFTNVIVAEQQTETYEPYKESISYIPLDSPLYEGDKIYLEDGELWEYRENGIISYPNNKFTVNQEIQTDNYVGFYSNTSTVFDASKNIGVFCDKLQYDTKLTNISGANKEGFTVDPTYNVLRFCISKDKLGDKTIDEYLTENPVEFVLKLATPTRKKLGSAEAFNLRTFNERTYIEVCGSEELGTENAFIVPRNQSGGIMTDAFCTAKRNEIQAAEQANLASRIAALEALAVKEIK